MAIKRRQNKLQDLAASGIITNRISGSIPFEYSGPNSPLFTISEIPNPAPQGKSSFLIAGTELLKNSVEVKIELIDSEGGVIYTEPVANYLEGNARRVSIEVYDDTPPGPANLFILAQVDPDEWEDETGTDVRNFPNPSPPKNKGLKRKKRRRKQRAKRKQMFGMPELDDIRRMGAGAFFINPNFRPPPGNDTRFRRRRGRRRRGRTADISDQYNFLQKIEMQIVPTATNTEKILFYQEPRLTVVEAFKPFVENLAPSASLVFSGSLEGQVINDTQAPGAASALDSFGARLKAFRRRRKFKKFAGKGGLSKRKRITRRASPEVDNYSFSSNTFNFTSAHVGATVNLNNPSVDSTQFPASRYSIPTTGSFEVIKVKNSSTVIPDKPFRIRDNQLQQVVDAPITHASFSITFVPEVTQSISITNFRSYADVRVANIRTFSGDVFRTKIYRKSEESIGDYEIFADLPLESSELLLNTNEGTGLERTGYFTDQTDINKFWEVSQSSAGVTGAASASVLSYDIDTQMDAVYISGSTLGVDEFVQVKLKNPYKFRLDADVGYDFSAEIYGRATDKVLRKETGGTETKKYAQLEVYISGSNIPAQEGNEAFGAKLGVLRIDDGSLEKDFKVTTGDFESTATSTGCNLIFKIIAGKWYLSDLSVRPATETGFSPDLFTFQAPMPTNEVRPEKYEFLAEFYDVNNNQADSFAFTTDPANFVGSNMVITGTDNVLESNLFIGGESTASGMHLGGVSSVLPETGGDGAAGSGFMRSVGYTGFTSASDASLAGKPGFMIYSGSVLPDSGDNYDGVGLELIGESGSLRFSTKPSRFEVQADAFFVGRQSLQFISGAAGNIEISSSNFHLSRTGDVTMQGTITADAGNIGGFTITSTAIASPDKSLIMSGSGQITGSTVLFTGGKIASFELSDDALTAGNTFFISSSVTTNNGFFISSSNFNVKASGDVTGSNVLFTGGKIASFELSDDAFTAGNSFFISSSVENDNSFFISSSKFNVKAGGDVSGSSVLFDGGTIAGWTIGDTTLTGGNLILSKDGSMRSSNYVSDFSGWKISAEDNGFAEFENVKIRGTLSTTTFEKESVNAVGGQLFVANSTALTGSAVAASDATMSVVNASGFQTGEILVAKKVTNTGFTTEYISVDSASLDGDLTKDELHGRIYVTRSIGTSPPAGTDSGSVGDTPGNAQDYEPGQVLASTGRLGTGYIRINANPNDSATPYIDIVERTGSSPYDVELKARIGDLSGAAGTRNVPLGFTGFGLMSEVAFLSGSNIKLEAPAFLLGDRNSTFVSGSNGKIEVSSSAFHLKNDGQLLVGDKSNNKYIEWDNSDLIVRGDISVDNLRTPSLIGGVAPTHANASASISSSGQVAFRGEYFLGDEDTTFISGSNSNLQISSSKFHLQENGDVSVTGEINATSGIFSGNLTSTATITGGTIQTNTRVNSTLAENTAIVIDSDSNTLMYYTDIHQPTKAFGVDALPSFRRTLFLDDTTTATAEASDLKVPGIFFDDYDWSNLYSKSQSRNPNSTATGYHAYSFGRVYADLNSAITGRMINVNRGQLPSVCLGDQFDGTAGPAEWTGNDHDGDGGGVASDDHASMGSYTCNGAVSTYEGNLGNPGGQYGGVSGSGSDRFMQNFKVLSIMNKPSIGFTGRGSSTQKKIQSGFLADMQITTPGNGTEGYNQSYNYSQRGVQALCRSPNQESAMSNTRYIERKFSTNASWNAANLQSGGTYIEMTTTTTSFLNSLNGSPSDTTKGKAAGVPSNVTRLFYRIKGTASGAGLMSGEYDIKIRIRHIDGSGGPNDGTYSTILTKTVISGGSDTSFDTGHSVQVYNGKPMNPLGSYFDNTTDVKIDVLIDGGSGFGYGVGDAAMITAADSYVHLVGDNEVGLHIENYESYGFVYQSYPTGSNVTKYGAKMNIAHGDTAYGYWADVRCATTAYGIYASAPTSTLHNRAASGTAYAGYFAGLLYVAGNIEYTGTITDVSDERLKTNITPLTGSLEKIKQIEVRNFKWRDDLDVDLGEQRPGTADVGFIAQQVEPILPELVHTSKIHKKGTFENKDTKNELEEYKFMNYQKMIPLLTEALQEQQKTIEELKQRIEVLENGN